MRSQSETVVAIQNIKKTRAKKCTHKISRQETIRRDNYVGMSRE